MLERTACTLLVAIAMWVCTASEDPAPASQIEVAVARVLDDFHDAASKADGTRYFAQLAPDAVFLGTDASERWTKESFRAFCEPYFSQGKGWTYVARDRHVAVAPERTVAWFDEKLTNAKYGECRGTGVLRLIDGSWRIAQYHLTVPIPNELAEKVIGMIREQSPKK